MLAKPTRPLALAVLSLVWFVPVAGAADADADGWRKLFDGKSLEGWKETDFFKPGKVVVRDGAVVLEKGNDMTGITYGRTDFPKTNYEVTLEGKRLSGSDFFCTTTFPVGDAFCSFVVGGWGGSTIGISSINGADASENETNASMDFENDRWYRIRIRVTEGRIETWIGDQQKVDLDTTDRKLTVRLECRPCQPFGVATWNTVGAVRDIKVRKLGEKELAEIRAKRKKE